MKHNIATYTPLTMFALSEPADTGSSWIVCHWQTPVAGSLRADWATSSPGNLLKITGRSDL